MCMKLIHAHRRDVIYTVPLLDTTKICACIYDNIVMTDYAKVSGVITSEQIILGQSFGLYCMHNLYFLVL